MANLYLILIHCRIYTLTWYIDEHTAETIPYVKTLGKNTNLAQNQTLVGSQTESSTKNPKILSANQNWVSQCQKNPNALNSGGGLFSFLGSCWTESARYSPS